MGAAPTVFGPHNRIGQGRSYGKKREAAVTSALMSVYRQAEVAFDHGKGAYIFDVNGRQYLDFNAGIAVSTLATPIRIW